jgi:phytoene desaturase
MLEISKLTKKKIIIIGAGVSGLTSGIYALDNGFDVEIYEKHSVPGGECTGWTRQGQYIDGCAHWIVGTSLRSELYPLWEHIGAFDGNPNIFETEYITKFQLSDGRVFTFYSDLEKLKNEMLYFFPEDRRNIHYFISTINAYRTIHVPAKKPLDFMNFFEFTLFGLKMFPAAYPFFHYKHISIEEYISTFNNRELGNIIARFIDPSYNIHSFFYICQAVSKGDAGMIEGGSLKLMEKVAKRFTKMGGKLFLGNPVKKIIIRNDNACGVELEDGRKVECDYVIAACDAYHTLYKLLDGRYRDKSFEKQFSDPISNPINTSVMVSFKTTRNMNQSPKMMDYLCEEFDVFGKKVNHFCVRNFSFDKSLPSINGETLLTVLLPADIEVYEYLKGLTKEEYKVRKNEVGKKMYGLIKEKLGLHDGELQLLDVTTPLTYERYTNAYKGSYMSFITTKFTKGLMRPGIIKGLHSFVLAGQWIMPPGGLPIALISGKHAVMRICKIDGRTFTNKEDYKFSFNFCLKKPKTT